MARHVDLSGIQAHLEQAMFHPDGVRGAQRLAKRLVRDGELPPVARSIKVLRKEVRLSPTVAQVLEAIDRLAEEAPAFGECERATQELLRRLETEKNPQVKEAVIVALGRLGETTAAPALEELVGHHRYGEAAGQALEQIAEEQRKPDPFKARMAGLRREHDRGRGE